MADVKYIIDAEEAKAFGAFQRLVKQQVRAEKQFGRTTKSANKNALAIVGINKASIGAALGVTSLVGAITNVGQSWIRNTKAIGAANMTLEQELRALFALANNAGNTQQIRDMVLSQSVAFGQASKTVADAQFLLTSAVGQSDQALNNIILQNALIQSRLGGDVATQVAFAAKTWLIYRDALREVGIDAQKMNVMLSRTADLAVATPDELAAAAPASLAAGAARGVRLNQILGLLAVSSGVSGTTAEGAVASRNLINRLPRAAEELGIVLEGTLTDQLRQVSAAIDEAAKTPTERMKLVAKIFEERLSGYANTILENSDKIDQAAKKIMQTNESFNRQRLSRIRTDPASLGADIFSTASMMVQNVNAIRASESVEAQDKAIALKALEFQAKLFDPSLDDVAARALAAKQVATSFLAGGGMTKQSKEALRLLEKQVRQGGDAELADAIRLRFGNVFGLRTNQQHFVGPKAGPAEFTNFQDAADFALLRSFGSDITVNQFVQQRRRGLPRGAVSAGADVFDQAAATISEIGSGDPFSGDLVGGTFKNIVGMLGNVANSMNKNTNERIQNFE